MKINRPLLFTFCVFINLQALAAVIEIAPQQIEARKPIDVTQKHISRTVDFTAWKVNIDPIDIIGTIHPGVFCSDAQEKRYWTHLGDWLRGTVRDIYIQTALKAGYPKHQAGESAFEQKIGSDADFKAGVTLTDLKYSICGTGNDVTGSGYVKMKWELFSVLRQKVVYTKAIEASFSNKSGAGINGDDFFRKLIEAEVDNLLAETDFVSAFESGDGGSDTKAVEAVIALKSTVPAKVDVQKSSIAIQSAVVTVESGLGVGSGFFISDDGYLLTNEHVVGGAKYVKLKTLNGKSLIGQVIRIDSIRDVALIKTESGGMPILAVSKSVPVTGESVYAIGSPYGEQLAGTMTQGVLSSRRVLEGVTYLQSDASISHGNSGGPLIDATGAVIGIAQIIVGKSGGINLFIPIDEALEKLSVTVN
ncbi:serine protease Do [Oxalobacteraceae bacterium GrIS 2.11]